MNIKMAKETVKTLIVDNFGGRLTRNRVGNINSGYAFYDTSWGYNPFTYYPSLMFIQAPISIKGSVITDLIVAAKARIESGITYVYAIGHTKRLYKIQVNDPVTYNPDYDNPVLLGTLANSQTFLYGGSLDFYQGSGTEKIWIGHDTGMTKINFDGSGETNLTGGSWVSNVPRIQKQFAGSIYIANGSNIAKIDSTEAVTSYTVLSPGFPANTQCRDIDVTSDGRYLVMTVSRSTLGSIIATSPDLSELTSESFTIYWNGSDTAASSFVSNPNFSQTTYQTFGSSEFTLGYDITGACLGLGGQGAKKLFTLLWALAPLPNGVSSSGDFLGFMQVEGANGNNTTAMSGNMMYYGTIDAENPTGLYRPIRVTSTLSNGDIIRCPSFLAVSNEQFGGLSSGYPTTPLGVVNTGTGKTYFSTLEYNGTTTSYNYYAFHNAWDAITGACLGNYDTQVQLFSQKVKANQVRIYTNQCAGNESFTISILGPNGLAISGTTKTFSAATGDDKFEYNPQHAPTFGIGVRVTNASTGFPIINKIEIDYSPYGN